MTISSFCPISGESPEEERINYLTHLVGLFLSLVGWITLIVYTHSSNHYWHWMSCLIYGTTLVLLYAASTYYHRCQVVHRKRILRIVDHICIYLLIAGTYTPFALGPLKDHGGIQILAVEWSVALMGIMLKIFAAHRFQTLSVLSYLAMGWLVVFNFPALLEELSLGAVMWLAIGGLSYTLGVIFFIWENLPFNHAVWHVFVLGGSACHYCSILDMVRQGVEG